MSKLDKTLGIQELYTQADLSEIDSLNDIRALIEKNDYFKNPDAFLSLIKELFRINEDGKQSKRKTKEYKRLILKYISNARILEDGKFEITNIKQILKGEKDNLNYEITRRKILGKGTYGLVREVKDNLGNEFALKISLATEEPKLVDDLLEILLLIFLSTHSKTGIFFPQKVIPFIRSNNPNIDIEINQKPELLKNYKAKLYVLQEKYDIILGDYLLNKKVSLQKKLNVLAQVGFGLYVSKRIFSFIHSDFKFNNIMIKLKNPKKKIITETIDGKTYELVIKEGEPLVKFIDLGMTSIIIDNDFLISKHNPKNEIIIKLSKCEYKDLFYFIYTFYLIKIKKIKENQNKKILDEKILDFFRYIIEKNNIAFKKAATQISNIDNNHFLNTVKNKTELKEVINEINEVTGEDKKYSRHITYINSQLNELCQNQEINENINDSPLYPRNFIKAILEYAQSKSYNLNLKEIN